MIQIDRSVYRSLWVAVGIVNGGGWVAYGLLGSGNKTFLAIMVIASMVLAGGTAVLFRPR